MRIVRSQIGAPMRRKLEVWEVLDGLLASYYENEVGDQQNEAVSIGFCISIYSPDSAGRDECGKKLL
jgi:hypothetical protein